MQSVNHLGTKLGERQFWVETAAPRVVTAILIISISLVVYAQLMFTGSRQMGTEHGLLETLQQLWIALAGIAFAAQFFRGSAVQPRERSLILAALCTSFLLRESDVEVADKLGWLTYWVDESGRTILVGSTWAAIAVYLSGRIPLQRLIRSNLIFDASFRLLAASLLMLLIGWAYDRKHLITSSGMPIEEQCEVIAYSLILLAGLDNSRQDLKWGDPTKLRHVPVLREVT